MPQFGLVENKTSTFVKAVDANVFAAVTQSATGHFTSIVSYRSGDTPGTKAWQHMMERAATSHLIFINSVELRFSEVRRCSTMNKFIGFLDMIDATERSMYERGMDPQNYEKQVLQCSGQ